MSKWLFTWRAIIGSWKNTWLEYFAMDPWYRITSAEIAFNRLWSAKAQIVVYDVLVKYQYVCAFACETER